VNRMKILLSAVMMLSLVGCEGGHKHDRTLQHNVYMECLNSVTSTDKIMVDWDDVLDGCANHAEVVSRTP
jgi:hypothetical protein